MARNESVKNFMQNRAAMSALAKRFVGGKNISEVIETSRFLKSKGYTVSLFYLGEYVENLELIKQTVSKLKAAATTLESLGLDIFICVDPTQIGYQTGSDSCYINAFEIAKGIKQLTNDSNSDDANFLMVDMEDSSVTEATITLYKNLVQASLPAALTLQAYLYRTERDLNSIIVNGGKVRLVKGAFAEGKEIAFSSRSAINNNYLKLAKMMLSDKARQNGFYPIFATHDDSLVKQIIKLARHQGWAKERYEFEMLYGVRVNLQEQLVKSGEQVRLYLPFGVDWWPYAVRRVGENPANAHFLLRSLLNR